MGEDDLSFDDRDDADIMPKCSVIEPAFTWGNDSRPDVPWHHLIVYEMHVKGFTKLNPLLPERLRGTYAGLATAPVIDYLTELGITAVELLPVHTFVNDRHLVEKGLTNYWGYNSIGFLPQTCATRQQVISLNLNRWSKRCMRQVLK